MLSVASSINSKGDIEVFNHDIYESDSFGSSTWSLEALDGTDTVEESLRGWVKDAVVLDAANIARLWGHMGREAI